MSFRSRQRCPGWPVVLPNPTNGTPNVPENTAVPVAVMALDAQGRPDFTYNGTANVVVTNGGTSTPATAQFQNGFATIKVTFTAAGAESVTVTDQTTPSLTATLNVNVVNPSVVTKYVFQLASPTSGGPLGGPLGVGTPSVPVGQTVAITVTALNGLNQPVTGYTGPATIVITGTAGGTTTLQNVNFTNGVYKLTATFATAGPQTVTVSDVTNTSLTNTLNLNVFAPVAPSPRH